MILDIQKQHHAFKNSYRVYVNEVETYHAETAIVSFVPILYLYDLQSKRPRFTLTRTYCWFTENFTIELHDRTITHLKAVSTWKSHYSCQFGADLYEVYGHKGRKYSVYKNQVQVAWWDKQQVSWFDGENFRMIADDDAEKVLLLAFLFLLQADFAHKSGTIITVSVDFGQIGPQARAFDPEWQPNLLQA